jgi:hypothetical protein
MRILRALVLVLMFANLLLFAAAKGYLGGGKAGEPERLADQLDAQKIVIVQAGMADTVVQDGGERTPAPPAATPSEAAPAKGAADAPESCRRYAPLPRERALRIAAMARDARLKVVQKPLEEPSSWWVHIPAQPSREEVDKRTAELRAAGVNEFFIVQEPGPNHFAVSLGLFKAERMAQDLRDRLRAKGVSQARVSPRDMVVAKVGLELRGSPEQMDRLLAQVSTALPGVAAQACAAAPQAAGQ